MANNIEKSPSMCKVLVDTSLLILTGYSILLAKTPPITFTMNAEDYGEAETR